MSETISASATTSGSQLPAVRLLRTLRGHEGVIHRLAWSPSLLTVASPSRDGTVRIWDFQTGELRAILADHRSWVNAVAWSPDAAVLAAGTETGEIFIWSIANASCERAISAHRGRIECLAWSTTQDILASASADGTIAIWRVSTGHEVQRLEDHHAWVNAVAWSPDGRYLATGAEDPTVKLWDASDFRLLHTLRGHAHWVTDIAWLPDSSLLASAADRTIRLWDPNTGRLVTVLTGHEDRVKCLSFSFDGRLLASKGDDNTVRLWRSSDWRQVFTIDEPTVREINPENNLAFHPCALVLATLGELDTVIRLWSIDLDVLLHREPPVAEVFYRNAKVALIGAASTGKSCLARALLGLPFEPQESSHGMKVWPLRAETVTDAASRTIHQEVFLWDFAGQVDYQLVHQLFLDQTSLALILFDPTEPEDTLPGVRHWVEALHRAAGEGCPRLLVAGRVDRGTAAVSDVEIRSFLHSHGFAEYVATSAKTGEGIPRLLDLVRGHIPWEDAPLTQSPALWRDLRSFIFQRRSENDVLARCADLKIAFRLLCPATPLSDRAFDTVVAHLQTQGLVWRLSFGDLVLLRPELLNDYASAVVLAARRDPRGLGSLVERDVLDVRIDLSSVDRIADVHAERSLLHAVVQLLLDRQIALREGTYLVFPSRTNIPRPTQFDDLARDAIYHFSGAAEIIYASLVVRLATGGAFELDHAWRAGAVFRDSLGRLCGVSKEPHSGSKHQLGLYFAEAVAMESKVLFSRFVHDHIHRLAIEGSVERERQFRCTHCGEEIRNVRAVMARLRNGRESIVCQFCESAVPIFDDLERRFGDPAVLQQVRELEMAGTRVRDREVGVSTATAKSDMEEFDVFLAYNSRDEKLVEAIATELRRRGINPWFAKWCLPPGRQFQREIQRVFFSVRSVAVFVGPDGVGPWETLEIQAAIQLFVKRQAPVIPVVIAPGRSEQPELPLFLREFAMVSFQNGSDDVHALDLLEWGITGAQPRGLAR